MLTVNAVAYLRDIAAGFCVTDIALSENGVQLRWTHGVGTQVFFRRGDADHVMVDTKQIEKAYRAMNAPTGIWHRISAALLSNGEVRDVRIIREKIEMRVWVESDDAGWRHGVAYEDATISRALLNGKSSPDLLGTLLAGAQKLAGLLGGLWLNTRRREVSPSALRALLVDLGTGSTTWQSARSRLIRDSMEADVALGFDPEYQQALEHHDVDAVRARALVFIDDKAKWWGDVEEEAAAGAARATEVPWDKLSESTRTLWRAATRAARAEGG